MNFKLKNFYILIGFQILFTDLLVSMDLDNSSCLKSIQTSSSVKVRVDVEIYPQISLNDTIKNINFSYLTGYPDRFPDILEILENYNDKDLILPKILPDIELCIIFKTSTKKYVSFGNFEHKYGKIIPKFEIALFED